MINKIKMAGDTVRSVSNRMVGSISSGAQKLKTKASVVLKPVKAVLKREVKDRAIKAGVDTAAAAVSGAGSMGARVGINAAKEGLKHMTWGTGTRKVITSTVGGGAVLYTGNKVRKGIKNRNQPTNLP